MTKIFIVRGEQRGAPESVIFGVYPTEILATARCNAIKSDEDNWAMDYVWFDIVNVGPNGADCAIFNR